MNSFLQGAVIWAPRALNGQKWRFPARAGELREYQLVGINWLYHAWCRNTNAILADGTPARRAGPRGLGCPPETPETRTALRGTRLPQRRALAAGLGVG